MELIYLWIKEYKNIDEIGIPLEINYIEAEDTKFNLKNNNLTIRLSTANNYNVFGNYLNIKTFVGANGSGKSNITTALCYILKNGFKESVDYDFEDYSDNTKPELYCLIYKDNDSYQYTKAQNVIDHLKVLELEKRYNYYQNIIKSTIYKRVKYNTNYIAQISKITGISSDFVEASLIKQDLLSENEPFLKLKTDIWEQIQ